MDRTDEEVHHDVPLRLLVEQRDQGKAVRPGDHAQFMMTCGNSERLGRSGNETPENKQNSEKQTRMSPGAGRDSKVQGDKSGDLGHKLN